MNDVRKLDALIAVFELIDQMSEEELVQLELRMAIRRRMLERENA